MKSCIQSKKYSSLKSNQFYQAMKNHGRNNKLLIERRQIEKLCNELFPLHEILEKKNYGDSKIIIARG